MSKYQLSPAEVLQALKSQRRPRPSLANPFIAPRNTIEVDIAGLWTEVLCITEVGAEDHFFDLGGDSLHMIQIISRLRSRFQVEISIGEFFDNPTVSALAQLLMHSPGE
jgi:acyl carrier protein